MILYAQINYEKNRIKENTLKKLFVLITKEYNLFVEIINARVSHTNILIK